MLHALGAQIVGAPAAQLPPAQVSKFVHALPSEHAAPSLPATEPQPPMASHVSIVHGLASLQSLLVGVPAHSPPPQVSLCVQLTPSLHGAVLLVVWHPRAVSQLSSVHGLPSLHVNALPLHAPLAHASASVQALLSVQGAPSLPAGVVQPVAGSQPSAVHGLPSLQVLVVPSHVWPTHVSDTVHALPSLHGVLASALLCTQPTLLVQLSMLHGLLSSHAFVPVEVHAPPAQMSPVVHGLPSSQAVVLFWCTQPSVLSQASAVQNLLSSQFGATPPMQLESPQVSLVVHALPSSHGDVLGRCTQPTPSAHESLVHKLPSSQPFTLPEQTPPLHVSFTLHTWPSSHAMPSWLVKTQPVVGSQLSTVHRLLSLHVCAEWPRQAPPPQISPSVHAFWSSQALVLLVNTQPVVVLHVSVVQPFWSSHGALGVPVQVPWLHASLPVHAFLSSQVPVTGVLMQPLLGSQLSSVQTLLSSQLTGLEVQTPAVQMSPVVHALPSSQAVPVSAVFWQPCFVSQTSAVHGFLSSQETAVAWLQLLFLHVSPLVHALPSSHVTAFARNTQPPSASLQLLSVHGLLSSQPRTVPRQVPWLHVSLVLHALPSLQAMPLANALVQPFLGSQLSVVHALLSLQSGAGPPVQRGPAQVSLVVHALPSSQPTTVSAWMQPFAMSQLSAVQALPSSQLVGSPAWQLPFTQVSFAVHALPSEQPPVSGVVTQPLVVSHVTEVHVLLSLHATVEPVHVPVAQLSPLVHALLSSQAPVYAVLVQPETASHRSTVHGLPSSHLSSAPPTHALAVQASASVHALLSLHVTALGKKTQPVASAQVSSVHGLLSLQPAVWPMQLPFRQASLVLHA